MPPFISLIWTLGPTHTDRSLDSEFERLRLESAVITVACGLSTKANQNVFYFVLNIKTQNSPTAAVSETAAELSDSLPDGLCPPLMTHIQWNFPRHPDRRLSSF